MPSRKQRRRREKLQRHEWEYVVEGEEGDEVVVERPRAADERKNGRGAEPTLVDRRGRPLEKPTVRRTLRRGAIFAPLLVILVFLLGGDLTTGQKLYQAVVLIVVFIPFSYLIDTLVYRAVTRRHRSARSR